MTHPHRTTKNGNFQPRGRWIRSEKRLAIYLRDYFECVYCYRDLHGAGSQGITLDHLRTRSHGGHNHERNLVTACRACNCSRQDRPWRKFLLEHVHRGDKDAAYEFHVAMIVLNRRRSIKRYLATAKAILAEPNGGTDGNQLSLHEDVSD